MAQNQNNVSKVYKNVIEEVIKNVREAFLNDGVDEQVLQELKQIWESKVTQSGAVSVPEPKQRQITKDPKVLLAQTPMVSNTQQHQFNVVRKNTPIAAQPTIASTQPITGNQQSQNFIAAPRSYIANIQQPHAQYTQVMLPAGTLTTIPQQQQISETQTNQQPLRQAYHGLTVSAIQPTRQTIQHNVQGQHIVTTPQLVTTQQQHVTAQQQHVTTQQQQHVAVQQQHVALQQQHVAAQQQHVRTQQQQHLAVQQQHVTAQQQHVTTQQQHLTVPQQASRPSVIIQVDGPNDSDSDDDDDDDDDNDLSHDEDGEDKPQEDSEPLNSDDDVSDDDSSELFETENVVVCQFDRITRSKNKWKFHLKDGIMNLDSNDYVFTKATGEAEW